MDLRVGVQELLNFRGVDILPSPDDHVFDSALDAAIAVAVKASNVSVTQTKLVKMSVCALPQVSS